MNKRQFGSRLTSDGASFRLWAPAAKRVDLLLETPQPMRRGEDGQFSADIQGVKAGARYKFRIDGEIDVPDPASAFQPDDVSGPSEVIDHAHLRGLMVFLDVVYNHFGPEGNYLGAEVIIYYVEKHHQPAQMRLIDP